MYIMLAKISKKSMNKFQTSLEHTNLGVEI